MIHILTSCYVGRLQLTASPRRAWCPGTTFWNINISTLLPARSDNGIASPCQFSPGKFVISLWGARGIMQESNSLFWVLWPSASLALQRGPALLTLNRGTLPELRRAERHSGFSRNKLNSDLGKRFTDVYKDFIPEAEFCQIWKGVLEIWVLVHLSATSPRHFDFLRLSLQTKLSFQKWRRGINQTSSVFWGAMRYQQRLWLLWAETTETQTPPYVWNCVVFVLWLPYFTWCGVHGHGILGVHQCCCILLNELPSFLRLSDVSLFVYIPLFLSVHHWWMDGVFLYLGCCDMRYPK